MFKREVGIKKMEGYDWLAGHLLPQDKVEEQFKHIDDIQIIEEEGSPLWAIRFRGLPDADQVLKGLDVEFVVGNSRVEASLCNLPRGFHRSKLIGSMMLEFPLEVEDISEVSAINLVTFAKSMQQVVKVSLVYAREKK